MAQRSLLCYYTLAELQVRCVGSCVRTCVCVRIKDVDGAGGGGKTYSSRRKIKLISDTLH